MGRLTNMIRSTLKNRMGDSLIDALLRTYKNSGHLEFWETHLDNLFHCHRNLMNCSSSVPIWPPRFKTKKNSCAKVFNFNPEPPKTRFSAKESKTGYSHQRSRNLCSQKRQLTLREVFLDEYNICDLEPSLEIQSQKEPKKRKIWESNRTNKRAKITEEENLMDKEVGAGFDMQAGDDFEMQDVDELEMEDD